VVILIERQDRHWPSNVISLKNYKNKTADECRNESGKSANQLEAQTASDKQDYLAQ
jgi:hypothetical protein